MAYIKIKPVKTSSHLSSTLSYITDPDKTDNEIWVTAYKCIAKYAVQNFEEVYKQAKMKKGNNLAHHICISFSPEDNISPNRAMNISQEVMKRMYPQFQYVLACHIDKKHIHCHIIVNAISKNFTAIRKVLRK